MTVNRDLWLERVFRLCDLQIQEQALRHEPSSRVVVFSPGNWPILAAFRQLHEYAFGNYKCAGKYSVPSRLQLNLLRVGEFLSRKLYRRRSVRSALSKGNVVAI